MRKNVKDNKFSTTKLCYKLLNNKYMDKNGKIKEECKFKINFPEFGIIDSKIPAKKDEKFDTYLFLPEREGRKIEGGLRTKGYFKFSYINKNNKWWIVENDDLIKEVELNEKTVKNYEELPLITIVTAVYNGEKYLEETIQSVINQTYPNVEYIIIDGGSTDGTIDIIKKYEEYIDYWVSEKDKNMYDAINKGISLSKGKLIASLNSDDRYKDFKVVEDINNFIKNNYKCDGIYGNVVKVYGNKYVEKKIFQVNFDILLCSEHSSFMPQPTLFLKRKVYFNERYNLNYNYASDYDFNLKIIKKYNICFFNRAITLFRQHEESITASGRLEIDRKKILQYYGLYDKSFIKRRVLFYFNWFRYKIRNFI